MTPPWSEHCTTHGLNFPAGADGCTLCLLDALAEARDKVSLYVTAGPYGDTLPQAADQMLALRARVAELEVDAELGRLIRTAATLCPEHGPNVAIDEDGCCAMCGNYSVPHWPGTLRPEAPPKSLPNEP